MEIARLFLPRIHAGCWLLLAVAAPGACGTGTTSQDDGPGPAQTADAGPAADAAPAPAVFVPCPGATEPGPTGLMGDDITREGTAGTIDVTVAFCNPLIPQPPDELLFFVILADHFGLAPSDVTEGTSVVTGAGLRTDGPITWDGDDLTVDDHHAKGHLHAPNHSADGAPLLGSDAIYLELTLGGIGENGSIIARWDEEYLPSTTPP